MKNFWRFYRRTVDFKLYASIYTLMLVFFEGLFVWLRGGDSIGIATMLWMLLVSSLFSVAQCWLFPAHKEYTRHALRARTVLWMLLGNLLFVGGTAAFGWFVPGMPGWGLLLVCLVFNLCLFFVWLALHIAYRADSRRLNDGLKKFQAQS